MIYRRHHSWVLVSGLSVILGCTANPTSVSRAEKDAAALQKRAATRIKAHDYEGAEALDPDHPTVKGTKLVLDRVAQQATGGERVRLFLHADGTVTEKPVR